MFYQIRLNLKFIVFQTSLFLFFSLFKIVYFFYETYAVATLAIFLVTAHTLEDLEVLQPKKKDFS